MTQDKQWQQAPCEFCGIEVRYRDGDTDFFGKGVVCLDCMFFDDDYECEDEDCSGIDCAACSRPTECPGGCGPRCACAYDRRDKMED